MAKKYLKTGMGLIGAGVITGAIPNITGSATETGLKANLATGISNVGTALPVTGKVVGPEMILKSVKKIKAPKELTKNRKAIKF